MRKAIVLSLITLISLCASAQSGNKHTYAEYIQRSGEELIGSAVAGIVGGGLAVGAVCVDNENTRITMLVGTGICTVVSLVFFVDAGISLNKAGKLLKEEQRTQEIVRIEPSREGVGVRFTF